MEVPNIQQKIKESQAVLLSYLDKGLKSPTVETILSNGKELLENDQVKQIVAQGKKIAVNLEGVRTNVQDKVKDVESQGRTLLQNRLAQVLNSARSVEGDLVQLADKAISDSEKIVADKAPFLSEILVGARKTISAIDEKFAGLQATALAGAGSLPIRDYDALNAKAAAAAVKKLGDADLLVVKAYEARNKNRSTVLNEIGGLLSES